MGLANKCFILDLHISKWSGYKTDQKASTQLLRDASAQTGSAVVSKRIIPREVFNDITTACNALNKHMTTYTLPWSDRGERIMTRRVFEQFMSEFGNLERNFNAAVEEFIDTKYPNARDQAAFRLGTLFEPKDYPSQDELRGKFACWLDFDGITEPNDFRIALPEAELAKLKASVEESIQRRLGAAMQDVWLRIAGLLAHYIEKMAEPEAIFRDSTVNNLVDLMNILPGLNVTGDPNLRAIRSRIMDTIGSYEPDDLRNQEDLRAAATKEAKEISEIVNGYLKGN